jgi:hypothetical protein
MIFQAFLSATVPNMGLRDTAQGKKRRFYGHNCNFGRSGRTDQHARDAELAGIL